MSGSDKCLKIIKYALPIRNHETNIYIETRIFLFYLCPLIFQNNIPYGEGAE